MGNSCPKCRSMKITHENELDYATCNYCNHEYYPLNTDDLASLAQEATEVTLPQYKNPLSISHVERGDEQITLHLTGQNGGEYKLILRPNHTGALKRRKSGSERNQFGSRWTNGTSTWPEALQ